MQSLLARFASRRAIGLLVTETEITASLVAATPTGHVEIARRSEPISGEPIEAVLGRVLAEGSRNEGWKLAPVAVGLPVLRLFFSTRPIKSTNLDATPQALLHEVLQSSNLVIDDMEVDMIKSQPGRQPVASIIATQKRYLRPILDALAACDRRPALVEPAPFGLLRASLRRRRTMRRTKGALRVFLGNQQGLAVLTALEVPLAWRLFRLNPGSEGTDVASIVSSMRTVSQYHGVEPEPDLVLIHGRPDLARLDESADWPLGKLKTRRLDGPAYEPADIATGLALGCHADGPTFNLARALKPRTPLLRLLPIGQAAVQLGVLGAVTTLLNARDAHLTNQIQAIQASEDRPDWFQKQSSADLEKERGRLVSRTEAIKRYLEGRVVWSECLHDVVQQLPPGMTASVIEGHARLGENKRSSSPDRTLALSMKAPIPGDGVVPAEVDTYAAALRQSRRIRNRLPVIRLSGLHWVTDEKSHRPFLAFTVNCQSQPTAKGTAHK